MGCRRLDVDKDIETLNIQLYDVIWSKRQNKIQVLETTIIFKLIALTSTRISHMKSHDTILEKIDKNLNFNVNVTSGPLKMKWI